MEEIKDLFRAIIYKECNILINDLSDVITEVELFTYKKCQVDIELEGVHTRGMTVVSEGENCLLVEHLNDRTLYNQYFMEDLSILEERYSSSR